MRGVLITVLIMLAAKGLCADGYITRTVPAAEKGIAYRIRASTESTIGDVWPQLDIAWKNDSDVQWGPITARKSLVGVRCPRELNIVNLISRAKRPITAIAISGEGDTTSGLQVIEVVSNPSVLPTLKTLLSQQHEGKISWHYDSKGTLAGFTTRFVAVHLLTNESLFPGHIVLARDLTWSATKDAFFSGPLYPDANTESQMNLVDILAFPGSERLGINSTYDSKTKNTVYIFKPTGILRSKVRPEFRSAKRVKVMVGALPNSEELKVVGEYAVD